LTPPTWRASLVIEMPGSVTSVFSEAEAFETALREEGCLGLLVTGQGAFRARLTQIALHRLRISAGEEQLPRIALFAVPAEMILVALPIACEPMPVWGGIRMRAGEIITLGAGRRMHMRTEGACRWSSIWLPAAEFDRYGSAMTGNTFSIPSAVRWWRLRPATSRYLRQLHAAAVNLVERRSTALSVAETAHGLEQQLIEGLVECLSKGWPIEAMPATTEHQDIAARFEALLQTTPGQFLPIAKICAALGVSAQILRICCDEQLGMGPTEYARRWRMQLVHRTLLNGNAEAASISAVARRCGFRSLGSFAASYRALYGELPSVTLRRGLRGGAPSVTLGRPGTKLLLTALSWINAGVIAVGV
jgi:AraC family transcriptional regulator, ethanolamine operon transcriptional activator